MTRVHPKQINTKPCAFKIQTIWCVSQLCATMTHTKKNKLGRKNRFYFSFQSVIKLSHCFVVCKEESYGKTADGRGKPPTSHTEQGSQSLIIQFKGTPLRPKDLSLTVSLLLNIPPPLSGTKRDQTFNAMAFWTLKIHIIALLLNKSHI